MNTTQSAQRSDNALNKLISETLREARAWQEADRRKDDFRTYLVHLNEEITPQVSILTMGGIPVATEGNISAIVGEAKSKKTFLCTALIGGLINEGATPFFGVKPQRNVDVLWVDTEQSRTHVQLTARRIYKIAELHGASASEGNDTRACEGAAVGGQAGVSEENALRESPRFKMLALREIDPKLRTKLLFEAIEAWRPRVIVIDGISDLLYNTNDLEESERLVTMLMATSSRNKCHIFVVLHTNPNSDKARGHIGSALLRKAETVIYVRRAGDCSMVEPQYCRNEPFAQFAFRIDEEGIPALCDITEATSGTAYDDVLDALRALGGRMVERKLLVNKLSEQRGCSESVARVRITRATKQGLITPTENDAFLSLA